jgi:hypothetical protein
MDAGEISSIIGVMVGKTTFTGWMTLGLVLLALIKVWPVLQLQAFEARAKLRGEKLAARQSCEEKIEKLNGKVEVLSGQIHALDIKLVGTTTAYRILHADISEHRPDAPALAHANAVFRQVWDTPIKEPRDILNVPIEGDTKQ